jgi:uncharacterized membrane protein
VNRMLLVNDLLNEDDMKMAFKKLRESLPSASKIKQFANIKEPTSDDVIVYVDGGFDLVNNKLIKVPYR